MGHAIHTEGDPRAARLYDLAEECGCRGAYLDALEDLAAAAARRGKALPVNVTGAISAILLSWTCPGGYTAVSR